MGKGEGKRVYANIWAIKNVRYAITGENNIGMGEEFGR